MDLLQQVAETSDASISQFHALTLDSGIPPINNWRGGYQSGVGRGWHVCSTKPCLAVGQKCAPKPGLPIFPRKNHHHPPRDTHLSWTKTVMFKTAKGNTGIDPEKWNQGLNSCGPIPGFTFDPYPYGHGSITQIVPRVNIPIQPLK